MRDYIKNLLRENLLTEKLADVDSDVDLIYDKYFKEDVDLLISSGELTSYMFNDFNTYTSILESPIAIECHEKNPCKILINQSYNWYKPSERKISLGVNPNALNFIRDKDSKLELAHSRLGGDEKDKLKNDISEHRIKGSIHHELAHWIDDTLHNKHIDKHLTKASELGSKDVKNKPIDASKLEIEGQIHNIKQVYNKYKDKWDDLTFNDVMGLSISLNAVYRSLSGETRDQWIKDIKKRMYRENLLGDNMYN